VKGLYIFYIILYMMFAYMSLLLVFMVEGNTQVGNEPRSIEIPQPSAVKPPRMESDFIFE